MQITSRLREVIDVREIIIGFSFEVVHLLFFSFNGANWAHLDVNKYLEDVKMHSNFEKLAVHPIGGQRQFGNHIFFSNHDRDTNQNNMFFVHLVLPGQELKLSERLLFHPFLQPSSTLIVLGGGRGVVPCEAKFSEKCPYSHSNNTANKTNIPV